jgi:hypothetical protein
MTQRWVRLTGRTFDPETTPWLNGPIGDTDRIGADFFERLARRDGGSIREGKGLLPDMSSLLDGAQLAKLDPQVASFYENTRAYEIDVWSRWNAAFRPFGTLLANVFSRRLHQLNLPLDALDGSSGMTSKIIEYVNDAGNVSAVAWIRTLNTTNRVVYCGSYAPCTLPSLETKLLKVSFPLPNGNATVILQPQVLDDGSLLLISRGRRFGDPGFYFVVRHRERWYAKYVRSMRERLRVYSAGDAVGTDHDLYFFGMPLLQLRYKMRDQLSRRSQPGSSNNA